MQIAAASVAVSEMRPVYFVGHPPGPYPNWAPPSPSPPTISANKYPVFIRLRDALPRKYLKDHIVVRRY